MEVVANAAPNTSRCRSTCSICAKPRVPILSHRLFHSRTANMTLAAAFVHGMNLISLLQYLPLFSQAVELETAFRSAVSLIPTVIVSAVFAAISMMMVSVVGRYVWIERFGWIIIILGTGLLAILTLDLRHRCSLTFQFFGKWACRYCVFFCFIFRQG
ncbi:uncharacterized protein EAF01_001638 [Botrytis porri]|uniref:uncharacterized protein n=1 Tax=Botrytis porri TaxID=87229 RepID=UPI0018FFFC8B|nr:uncharacterized protein EAF01_001638 [Botrytis porri]KAF7912617.1 hypothetical protein EAF01_001638 [Botrytis porri]